MATQQDIINNQDNTTTQDSTDIDFTKFKFNLYGEGQEDQSTKIDTTLYQFDNLGEESDPMPGYNQVDAKKFYESSNAWSESIPAVWKNAQNIGMGGLLHEIKTGGKKKHPELNDVPRGYAFDLLSGLLSMFSSKEDIAIIGTGGVAGFALKQAARRTIAPSMVKGMGKLLTNKGMKKEVSEQAVEDFLEVSLQQGLIFSTYHGMYESAHNIRDEIIYNEDYKGLEDLQGLEGKDLHRAALNKVMTESKWQDYAKGFALATATGPLRAYGRHSGFLGMGKGTFEAGMMWEAGGLGLGLGPILYQRKPHMSDVVTAMGLVGALQLPTSVRRYVSKEYRLAKDGIYRSEIEPQTETQLQKKAAAEDRRKRRAEAVYTNIEEPLAKAAEIQGIKGEGGQLTYDKKGRPVVTGATSTQSDQIIKHINKRYLPDEIPSGPYGNTIIYGKPLNVRTRKSKVQEGSTEASFDLPVEDGRLPRILQVEEIPLFTESKIIYDTIKMDKEGKIKFHIQAGPRRYQLDSKNADLFIKFFTSDRDVKALFEKSNKAALVKSVQDPLKPGQKYFKKTSIDRQLLRELRNDATTGKKGFFKGDYDIAFDNVALFLQHEKWLAMRAEGKFPKVSDMTASEVKFLKEGLQDRQFMQNFQRTVTEKFDFTLRKWVKQPEGNLRTKTLTRGVLGSLMPAYGNMTTDAGRTLVRMLAGLDRVTTSTTSRRIHKMQNIMGMDTSVFSIKKALYWSTSLIPGKTSGKINKLLSPFHDPLFENWLTYRDKGATLTSGKLIGKSNQIDGSWRVSGFEDYIKIMASKSGRKNYKRNRIKDIEKIEALPNYKSNPQWKAEVNFLRRTMDFVDEMKKFTDEIYNDAGTTGMNLAGRIESAYLPIMIKPEIKQIIYNTTLSLTEKTAKIKGMTELGHTLDVARIKQIKPKLAEKIEKVLSDQIDSMAKKNDKSSRTANDYLQSMRKHLQKTYLGDGEIPWYDVISAVHMNLFSEGFKPFAQLEKPRRLGMSNTTNVDIQKALLSQQIDMMDKNLVSVWTDYTMGATKRIELSRAFTPSGQYFDDLLKLIPEDQLWQGGAAEAASAIPIAGQSLKARFKETKSGTQGFEQTVPAIISTERHVAQILKENFSGEDAFTRRAGFTGEASYGVAFFELSTKIAGGLAEIQNALQLFISVLPNIGFTNTFVKPLANLTRILPDSDKAMKHMHNSGALLINLGDELIGENRAINKGAERQTLRRTLVRTSSETPLTNVARNIVDDMIIQVKEKGLWQTAVKSSANLFEFIGRTAIQPFIYINMGNKIFAALGAESHMIGIAKKFKKMDLDLMKNPKKISPDDLVNQFKRRQYFYYREKIRRLYGINEKDFTSNLDAIISRTYNTKAQVKVQRKIEMGMEKFASETQQGRSFEYDPIFFNDPSTKLIFLFKRFPYRQAGFIYNVMKWEMIHGNFMAPLVAGAGGMFGGAVSVAAREWVKQSLSGEESFASDRGRQNWLSNKDGKYTINDITPEMFLNMVSVGGLFGGLAETSIGAGATGGRPQSRKQDWLFNEFLHEIEPVWISDFKRVQSAISTFKSQSSKLATDYRGDSNKYAPIRLAIRELMPIFGSMLNAYSSTRLLKEMPGFGMTWKIVPKIDAATGLESHERGYNDMREAGHKDPNRMSEKDKQAAVDAGYMEWVPKFGALVGKDRDKAEYQRGRVVAEMKKLLIYDNFAKSGNLKERSFKAAQLMFDYNERYAALYPKLWIDEYDTAFSEDSIQKEIIKRQEQFITPYIEDQDEILQRSGAGGLNFEEDVTNPE